MLALVATALSGSSSPNSPFASAAAALDQAGRAQKRPREAPFTEAEIHGCALRLGAEERVFGQFHRTE
jgi:hypothetical protein